MIGTPLVLDDCTMIVSWFLSTDLIGCRFPSNSNKLEKCVKTSKKLKRLRKGISKTTKKPVIVDAS